MTDDNLGTNDHSWSVGELRPSGNRATDVPGRYERVAEDGFVVVTQVCAESGDRTQFRVTRRADGSSSPDICVYLTAIGWASGVAGHGGVLHTTPWCKGAREARLWWENHR